MLNRFIHKYASSLLILAVMMLVAGVARGQSSMFVYQGKLSNSSVPANGNYEFEFKLYDASGNQVGNALSNISTTITNGIFSVEIDFGPHAFNGQSRWLEIAVRPSSTGEPYTVLSPRQPITSTPYALRSQIANNALMAGDADKLNGVPAGNYILSADARLSDARDPKPGSGNYVQNTQNQQANTNFNIAGNGTAGGALKGKTVEALDQFNLNGQKFLSASGENTFAGLDSGAAVTGGFNSFFGKSSGKNTTVGGFNSFFGAETGLSNVGGFNNSFFGSQAGRLNADGLNNSYFGASAGRTNISATNNSFFGSNSGYANTGNSNSFFGSFTGLANTSGNENSFFGANSGLKNTSGADNSFFGFNAGKTNTVGNSNTFIGQGAGLSNDDGSSNVFVGKEAGLNSFTGVGNVFVGNIAGQSIQTGSHNTFVGLLAGGFQTGNHNQSVAIGVNAIVKGQNLSFATAIGAGSIVETSNTIALGRENGVDSVLIPGRLKIETLGVAGTTQICRNATNELSACSSSLRYKTDILPFTSGLELVRSLRPVSFNWTSGGERDLGFIAEEVAEVEPLMATRNAAAEVEGVKYDRISAALVNAVKEQQQQIEKQQEQIKQQQEQVKQQQMQIEALKTLICQSNPNAVICNQQPVQPTKK